MSQEWLSISAVEGTVEAAGSSISSSDTCVGDDLPRVSSFGRGPFTEEPTQGTSIISTGHLICPLAEGISVEQGGSVWHASRRQGIWIPKGITYKSNYADIAQSTFLEVSIPELCALPPAVSMVEVSPLLSELLKAISQKGQTHMSPSVERLYFGLLQEAISHAPKCRRLLPMPVDKRAADIARELLKEPGATKTLTDWALWAGVSTKTITRAFRRETGVKFTEWRKMARVMSGASRLVAGDAAKQVTHDLGFATQSAFIKAFREVIGTTPNQYLALNSRRKCADSMASAKSQIQKGGFGSTNNQASALAEVAGV